jgi:hypothetical protein
MRDQRSSSASAEKLTGNGFPPPFHRRLTVFRGWRGCVRTASGPNVTGWSSPEVGRSYDVKVPARS